MSLLIFIAIVILILVLVMWAIYYLPMPPGSPSFLKNVVYVVLIIIAVVLIVERAGLLR